MLLVSSARKHETSLKNGKIYNCCKSQENMQLVQSEGKHVAGAKFRKVCGNQRKDRVRHISTGKQPYSVKKYEATTTGKKGHPVIIWRYQSTILSPKCSKFVGTYLLRSSDTSLARPFLAATWRGISPCLLVWFGCAPCDAKNRPASSRPEAAAIWSNESP